MTEQSAFDPRDLVALTFDVFGTVVDWRSGIMREAKAVAERHGVVADWGAFADAWRALYQPMLSKVREGEMEWTPLDTLHRMALGELVPRFGLGALGEAALAELNLAWHRLDPWPDVIDGMERLKGRYILATLSNGNIRLMVDMAKRAGLPWDAVLGAEVARHYKPQPEAYLATARLLAAEPARCLMVAAHYDDLVAARGCGFRTAYVHRPREYGDRPKPDLPAAHGLDLVVGDFRELADRLGC